MLGVLNFQSNSKPPIHHRVHFIRNSYDVLALDFRTEPNPRVLTKSVR